MEQKNETQKSKGSTIEMSKKNTKRTGSKRRKTSESEGKSKKLKQNPIQPTVDEYEVLENLPLALRLKPAKAPALPQISRTNWDKFEKLITENRSDSISEKVNECIARMRGNEVVQLKYNISSAHFVRQSIVDSVLKRNWHDLLQLLVILCRNHYDAIHFSQELIRNLCQILKYYHPDIRGTDLEDQIDLVVEKYERKRNKIANKNDIV